MIRWLGRISDLGATKLALIFGFNLTIWVFFFVPLLADFFPAEVQAKVFYYASGWVQLFALPLMVYVSNKIQRRSDEQAASQAELLEQVHAVVTENQRLARIIENLTASRRDLPAAGASPEQDLP